MSSEDPYNNACQGLIHRVFEAQVRFSPFSCAVDAGDKQLTYLELNENANKVASSLAALGVGPEELVGICLPRSIALIVGLVGILKAGAAYVPLDPALSNDQLAFMINHAKLSLIVTDKGSLRQLPRTSARMVCLRPDGLPETVGGSPANRIPLHEPSAPITPANLAYVNFTSGTTGLPKGVCIPHRGVIRLVRGTGYARFSPEEVFLHLSSICFDASTFEIWGCLLNGGRLVIFPANLPLANELIQIVQSKGITTLWLTSGYFNRVVDLDVSGLRGLRQLLIGGDVLSVQHVQRALDALGGCQLINGYGPTENTTFTCCYQIRPPIQGDAIPIGQPITNTYVHILRPDGQPVSPGEVGELHIGGAGLARGYLNREELTSRKFVRDPFSSSGEARLFKSGDRVRRLDDENIEFVGRMDRQVKLRGFRIELEGVEAELHRCPGVQDAAVVVDGKVGSKRLVAYLVPKPGHVFVIRQLRRQLKRLAYYAVPNTFVPLSRLPLKENGKTDYTALQSLASDAGPRDRGIGKASLTRTQEAVKDLWQQVLGVKEAELDDDFFESGGDSLQMVTLQAWIERRFNKTLCVSDCVKARSIRMMAELLDNRLESNLQSSPFVVRLRQAKHNARAPLFLAAAEADLHCYLHLASQFPGDQAIYGLQSPAIADGAEAHSIESIAAHHLRAVRGVQGSGPYYLGGYCFGGLVAFEMAQQLITEGEDVTFLGIIHYPMNSLDARNFRWAPSDVWKWMKNLAHAAIDLWDAPSDEVKRCIQRWGRRARYYCVERFNCRDPSAAGNLDYMKLLTHVAELPQELLNLTEIHYKAWHDYRPRPYPGVVTLFRPRRLPIFLPYDQTLGWKRIVTGRLDICNVPGPAFHGYMMSAAGAAELAKLVGRYLRIAQSTPWQRCHAMAIEL